MTDPYRALGRGYATTRRPDPRIARALSVALGDARTVVNVGAGSGSYEPADRDLVAVEPSVTMVRQRPPGAAPVVRAVAERLPFPDASFDVGMALLTTHHWTDVAAGLAELRRVSRRQVVLTWDPEVVARFWLVADYLPEVAERERGLATVDAVRAGLGPTAVVSTVEVPWDCADGFLAAFWRRPERYLDPRVRAGISGIAALPGPVVERGTAALRSDVDSGAWARRHGGLSGLDSADVGYRLVVA
ncbi:class I SAM-dependent methyltransferase [Actinokineospora pegani]|uniref:class I SAM-dependent methyltransferase n=1 Tax=Actinokineospora pegani TaxID=2654637 RepID=UPI0012EAECDB|nr:class I SAM-dependent methyltransferase [Actinokineospora pegani]